MKNLDVLAIQVETLRKQAAQFAGAACRFERLPQFHNSAPFAGIRLRRDLFGCGHKMRVIPGGHEPKSSSRIDLWP